MAGDLQCLAAVIKAIDLRALREAGETDVMVFTHRLC
jgi:hypothetical protein